MKNSAHEVLKLRYANKMYFCSRNSSKIDKWIEIQRSIATPVILPYLFSFLQVYFSGPYQYPFVGDNSQRAFFDA